MDESKGENGKQKPRKRQLEEEKTEETNKTVPAKQKYNLRGPKLERLTKECEALQRKSAEELRKIAEQLREQQKAINITKVSSNSVGAVAGGVSVAALILAPFTAGASLAVAAVAGGVGLASGAVDIAAGIAESKVIRNRMDEAQEVLNDLKKKTEDLLAELASESGFPIAEIKLSMKGGANAIKLAALGNTIRKAYNVAKATEYAEKVAASLGGGEKVAKAVAAAVAGAEGKAAAKAGAKAGFKALKPLSKVTKIGGPVLGAVGVGFNIYEIVDSSIKIHGGVSEGADNMEKIAVALLKNDDDK